MREGSGQRGEGEEKGERRKFGGEGGDDGGGGRALLHTPTPQQGFQVEVQEQEPKMEAVILAGKQTSLETQWSQGTPEKAAMDRLRVQYGTLEERWRRVSREAEEWGELLENVHPEMEKFQVRNIISVRIYVFT